MTKHVDLIAVGAMVLAFGFAAHVHEALHANLSPAERALHIRTFAPIRITPPQPPAVPHLPRLPRFPRV